MSKIVQTPGTISNIKTMSKCLRVTFDLQEMKPEEMAIMFSLNEKYGQVVFAEAEQQIKKEDIKVPSYAKIEKSDKTPSQRLRAVLYKIWQATGKIGEADDHYRKQMEIIIEHFKSQLGEIF